MNEPPEHSPLRDPFMMFLELGSYFPSEVATLFKLPSKREVEKFLGEFELTSDQLTRAIMAAGKGGYRHERFHFEHVPKDLADRSKDIPALLREKRVAEACGIISGIFGQRKLISAHLFENATEWHIFYCTQWDIAEGAEAHWKGGSHWHYVSYLFGKNLKKEDIWAALKNDTDRPFTGVHIKFKRRATSSEEPGHDGEDPPS
jgi:hypothetical protein